MAHSRRAKVKDSAKAFISTWRTGTVYTGSTANNQIKLPLQSTGTYKFTVDWGDSTSSVITSWDQAETLHTYPAPGDYTVTITGFIRGWDLGGGGVGAPTTGDMRKLLTITQWGCLRFLTNPTTAPIPVWGAFFGCTNLNLTAVQDMPNFKGTSAPVGFLRGCTAITTINNINKWDVSKIEIFRNTFRDCPNFDDNVGNWNTSKVTSMFAMFFGSTGPTTPGKFTNGGSSSIGNWDTSNVTDMNSVFTYQASFNHNLGAWDTSKVTTMNFMFYGCTVAPFGTFDNGGSNSIGNWNTSSVTNIAQMFQNQNAFNRNIGNWDTSKVTNMTGMFYTPATSAAGLSGLGVFNNDGSPSINNWDTSNVTSMSNVFTGQRLFNQPVGNWDTSKVTTMASMFYASNTNGLQGVFNQDISNWDTSKVTIMSQMFHNQRLFNQPIGNWDMSKVTNFSNMFNAVTGGVTEFNQDISNWNTSLVTTMAGTFQNASGFNQPIGNWDVSLVTNFTNFMSNKTNLNYSAANYDALLIGWASRPVQAGRSINFGTIRRTAASTTARAILTSAPNNWTIVDGGLVA